MRTLNNRRLVVLILCILIVGGAAHWLHGFQVRRNVHVFLREAQRAKQQNCPAEAVAQLQWYLRLVPEDVQVQTELGFLLADLARRGPAFMVFEEVLRRDPLRADVRRRLVRIAIEMGRYSDARSHLEGNLLKTSPNDAELLEMLGTCQAETGEYPQAQTTLERAIAQDQHRLEPYARLADLLGNRLGRPQDADAWMTRLVEANPSVVLAHILRSRYFTEGKRYELAMQDARKALELDADNLEALRLAALAALHQKQLGVAEQYARRGLALYPQHAQMYMTLSAVSLGSANPGEAVQWLRRGLEAAPDSGDLKWNLANLLLDGGQLAAAQEIIQQLHTAETHEVLLGYLRGRVLCAQGQWREASHCLEQLRPALKDWPDLVKQADYFLGTCYEHLGNADLQLAAYRRALAADPLWGPARVGAAAALVSLGRVEEALEEYQRIVKLGNASPLSWAALARLLILSNLRLSPAERRWDRVEQVLNQAAAALSTSSEVEILRAESLLAQGRREEAEDLLARALGKRPKDPELWRARVTLAQQRQDWKLAEDLLQQARQTLGDHIDVRLARAHYLTACSGDKAAAELRKLAEGREPFSGDDQRRLTRQLAALSLQIGDYPQSERLCRWLAEKDPNDLAIRLLDFNRARLASDKPGMERALGEIERIEGKGPLWLYHRAICLSFQATQGPSERLDQAQQHLAQARALRPAWSDVPALAADLYLQQAKEDLAIDNYLQAIELGNRNPSVIRRVVQLLNRQRRYVEADRVIRRLEEQTLFFSTELNRMAAEISLRLEDFDRALALARRGAESSKDYRDHLWLGQILGLLAQRDRKQKADDQAKTAAEEAEKAFRAAIELDKARPECWLAFAQFLARLGQTQRVEQILQEARKTLPPAVATLAVAQCYDSLGQSEKAAVHYQQALSQSSEDVATVRSVIDFYLRHGNRDAAEPQLRRMTENKLRATEEDVRWARRNQAMTSLARGDYPSLQHAAEMIRKNLAAQPPDADDLRAYALILGSSPQVDRRREATQVLENVLANQATPAPEDRFVLAQLYLAQNDWTGASRQMRSLLASRGSEPRYVAAYVTQLIQHKEMNEAELWLTRLEQIAPGDLSTASLRAEYCFERNRYEEALAALDGFLEKHAETPSGDATDVGRAGEKLESLGLRLQQPNHGDLAAQFIQRAEAAYQKYVEKHPEHRLVLTSFLARQKRYDEAVETLQQCWQTADSDLIAAAIGTLLTSAGVNSEPSRRTEAILAAALDKLDKPVPLLLVSAEWRTAQGRYDEAESLLRQAIAKDGSQTAAMNNLALLLALKRKNLDEAKQLMNRVIETAGPRAPYLDSRASVALAANEPKQAWEDLREAIAQSPTPTRYFHQALAQHRMGQTREAANAFKKAQQLGLTVRHVHPLERDDFHRLEMLLR